MLKLILKKLEEMDLIGLEQCPVAASFPYGSKVRIHIFTIY
jgi:hypothetical protein